ncbi:hypothetical protein DUNSADRAFT_7251 [Dunaliella salina]|uniref:Uncharacterized protein n=1 Tax=Dunaliella salina TaxID=3046 RepID=A0ABQ7GLS0_DUNSA|nr:hypothetical protein DUNSADRAFT_7251 [Dunaliella salina]|eukprot:KAF5835552.1 hypothetical protein DUNSADRAFT_7251 [Dunaliella salina]
MLTSAHQSPGSTFQELLPTSPGVLPELKRAQAALEGGLVQGTLQSCIARNDGELPSQGVERHLDGTAALSSSALYTRELACTASLYDAEEAQDGPGSPSCSYDMLYNHGLVLQELAARGAPGSPEHLAHLAEVSKWEQPAKESNLQQLATWDAPGLP